ncbi:hypothetical protein KP509_1Z035600 [Ceratopteris richardii]|nr:hypothetical protein KP509_1Z035600 [Ceratopteris richardii]
MGNCVFGGRICFSKQVVKLVHSNGLMEDFYRPVRGGQLLMDYRDHFICDAAELFQLLGAKSPNDFLGGLCLSGEEEMTLGEVYLLLPKRMLAGPTSPKKITESASMRRKDIYTGSTLGPLCASPRKEEEYADSDDDDTDEEEDEDGDHRVCFSRLLAEAKLEMEKRAAADPLLMVQLSNNAELTSALVSHMRARSCSRLWRPPLETINEDTYSSRTE